MEEAKEQLNNWLKPGDTIYTILRHVSRSGMMRHISVHIIRDNRPLNITWHVSQIAGFKQTDDGYLKVGGCGMDMGFHTTYSLGRKLYPEGFEIKKGMRNRNAINGAKPTDKGYAHDKDGGYAFNHEWL